METLPHLKPYGVLLPSLLILHPSSSSPLILEWNPAGLPADNPTPSKLDLPRPDPTRKTPQKHRRRKIGARHLRLPRRIKNRIRGICFYVVTAAAAIPLFAAMVAAHPFVLLFDRHRRWVHHLIAKVWATTTIVPFYRFKFEGLDNLPTGDASAVYVSNHQSFLDIYTLLTLGRCFKFISKTTIFVLLVVGWAMFLMGLIPLGRMDSRSRLDCLKRCMDLVRKGASVFFFPEGTRSKDGKLGMFKKGAFSIAAKTRVPIVPITLMGTGQLMPPGKEGILNSGSVKVVVHKPVEGTDADLLCKQARSIIANTLLLHGYGVHDCE